MTRHFFTQYRPFTTKSRDSMTARALDSLGLARKRQIISRPTAAGLICGSLAAGAALTFIFDPEIGRRRRKIVGDKVSHSMRRLSSAADVTKRDFSNRTRGILAGIRSLFSRDNAPDYIIEDRIRSRLGRVCSHPRALKVESDMGNVTISGPILEDELNDVIKTVCKTRGVQSVQDRLEPQRSAAGLPSLQGGLPPRGDVFDIARENWSPTTRLLAGGTGIGCMTYCLTKRDIPAILIGSVGFALFVRAASNLPARRLVGVGSGRRAIDVQKTININAPIDVVYAFWSNYDNFPLFMTHVKEVRDRGDGTSHWTVSGPAGSTVEWDACLTDFQPNCRIAWQSFPDATVANAGSVRFDENSDGTTRVSVRLSYNPPAGAIGHAVAALLGADPKTQLDQDLLRMKTLIETGRFPHDAAQHLTGSGATTSRR